MKTKVHWNVGSNNPNWKGGLSIVNGYIHVLQHKHYRANCNGYVRHHILIAEKVLGKNLPVVVVIHHHNGEKADNNNANLVICENNAYHKLLHKRKRALDESGHINYTKCTYCGQYDNPNNMSIFYSKQHKFIHKDCNTERCRIYRERRNNRASPETRI